MTHDLLRIVPSEIPRPSKNGKTFLAKGDFLYFHYCCDNYDDRGWGCAYRTLQSMCSWIAKNRHSMDVDSDQQIIGTDDIPSIDCIRKTLVDINDKPPEFLNSTDWLGALEVSKLNSNCWCQLRFFFVKSFLNILFSATVFTQVFYVIDTIYDISCRIQHIPSCHDIRKYSNIIKFYFETFGGLIMMGGDLDASSKCIVGIHIVDNDAYLLVVVSIVDGYIPTVYTKNSCFFFLCLHMLFFYFFNFFLKYYNEYIKKISQHMSKYIGINLEATHLYVHTAYRGEWTEGRRHMSFQFK